MIPEKKAILVLADGSFIVGEGLGAIKPAVGELVFNTSMTGYQEALTDPSYAGQILIFSYPLIGNYGFNKDAFESNKIHLKGAVVGEACPTPEHRSSNASIDDFLEEQGTPGISGVDTRSLVKKVREVGVMPCALKVFEAFESIDFGVEAKALLEQVKAFDYSAVDFVQQVSCGQSKVFQAKDEKKRVVVVDCGCKKSIIVSLLERGCSVELVPAYTSAQEILSLEPDGVLYSNGPGDPKVMAKAVEAARILAKKKPLFGICLGHQVIGLALGGDTFKLKFGHRGGNHAVKDVMDGRVFITSQNHGFAVKDLPAGVDEWMVNCLDGTNEGLKHKELPIASVQFHPEASPGPVDAGKLFDEFVAML